MEALSTAVVELALGGPRSGRLRADTADRVIVKGELWELATYQRSSLSSVSARKSAKTKGPTNLQKSVKKVVLYFCQGLSIFSRPPGGVLLHYEDFSKFGGCLYPNSRLHSAVLIGL